MAAAAPGVEVFIPLVVDDDELYLAELFVEEAEREYKERSFMYTYTKEGQELRQIMSVDGYDLGPYKENIPYWNWVTEGSEWITLFEDLDDYEFDGVDWMTLFQRENAGITTEADSLAYLERHLKRRRIDLSPII